MKKFVKFPFAILMILFVNSCQTKTNEKSIFLGGMDLRLEESFFTESYFVNQCIDEKTANNLYSANQIVFKNNEVYKVFEYDEGYKKELKIIDNIGFPKYRDVKVNQIYEFQVAETSNSFIGGTKPEVFKIPESKYPFQYFGKLSNKDQPFSELNFDKHLISPLYLNFDIVYLDYSNPLKPEILNKQEIEESENPFDLEYTSQTIISYEKMNIVGKPISRFPNTSVHSGIPEWIQYPKFPKCPKTNQIMKFICQIDSFTGVKAKTNVIGRSEYYQSCFEKLNFWADGDIYIFYQPESNVVAYLIQNT